MTIFGNLQTDGLEEAQDRVGGFRIFETDAYLAKIKLAYAGKASQSNAQNVTLVFDLPGGEYRETLWVTNKDGKNFYVGQDKKNYPLPGFTVVDDICMMTTDKPLSAQIAEEKVVNLYDFDQKKEVPTSVQMLVDLLGKEVILGIQKQTVNKQAKDGNGVYQDTADSRDQNVIDKVFHSPSQLTMVEAKRGVTTAAFYGIWTEKNRGRTNDRRKIKDGNSTQGGRTGRPGAGGPPKAGDGAAKTTSLFGASV